MVAPVLAPAISRAMQTFLMSNPSHAAVVNSMAAGGNAYLLSLMNTLGQQGYLPTINDMIDKVLQPKQEQDLQPEPELMRHVNPRRSPLPYPGMNLRMSEQLSQPEPMNLKISDVIGQSMLGGR